MALSRNEKRKRNYAMVRNEYQDAKLAQAARDMSDKKILELYGIDVTSKSAAPELRTIDKGRQSYYNSKLNKYQYAKEIGLDTETAQTLRTTTYKRIKSSLDYVRISQRRRTAKNIQSRKNIWKEWSTTNEIEHHPDGRVKKRKSNFPPVLEKKAIRLNREQGFDDYDEYGFAYTYFAFIENSDEAAALIIMPSQGAESYKYREQTTIKPI